MTTLTPERIEEIRKRLEALLGLPWKQVAGNHVHGADYKVCECGGDLRDKEMRFSHQTWKDNAKFIAHAPQDISDLLSTYDALSRDGMPDCVSPECPHYQMNQTRDGMREALVRMRDRDDKNGSLPAWYRAEIDAALSPDAPRQKEG